jgi:hypothetical protein
MEEEEDLWGSVFWTSRSSGEDGAKSQKIRQGCLAGPDGCGLSALRSRTVRDCEICRPSETHHFCVNPSFHMRTVRNSGGDGPQHNASNSHLSAPTLEYFSNLTSGRSGSITRTVRIRDLALRPCCPESVQNR